ncbi:MAG: FAD-dependent oxidoreductase [Ruminococcaceae bacterium]|nr:FAD-dependent oxidoreductase [Oscillospiraceae bacterium]
MKKYELLVLGGGFAGAAAAICAARRGVKTIIVDKAGALGGAATNCLIFPLMPNATKINNEKTELSQGILNEIKTELEKMTPTSRVHGSDFHEEDLKIILERMAIKAGVDLLYHALLSDVKVENGKLSYVTFAAKGMKVDIAADYFIDASGDADMAFMCGCPYRLGRDEDNLCQPMTTCFRVANVDRDLFFSDKKRLNELYTEKQANGEIKNPRENILVFKHVVDNVLHFNTTRIIKLNPTDPFDVTKAEIMAREQVFEMMDFLRANTESFKNAQLTSVASEIGVRESRMIKGEYILTGKDLVECKVFEDSIALGNYDIDIHNPAGTGTSHYYFPEGQYYTIPYRSLIPTGIDNMLVAGRCISCDHEAQASIRIMPIVCTLGEAAGVAVSCAKEQGVSKMTEVDVKDLQKKLVENGAIIK